jgi:hypothetical protein
MAVMRIGRPPQRHAVVWIDELPQSGTLPAWRIDQHREFEATGAAPSHEMAAVEFCMPTGPIIPYAMLGSRFRKHNIESLIVEVPAFSTVNPIQHQRNVTGSADATVAGGSAEYIPAILKAIERIDRSCRPRGTLTLAAMAHDAFGSSDFSFNVATQLLMSVLQSGCTVEDGARVLDECVERARLHGAGRPSDDRR